MSDYVNHALENDRTIDKGQKPVYKIIALVSVQDEMIKKFDEQMLTLNNRWSGRIYAGAEGCYMGWVSYTARGANMHDIKRKFETLTVVIEEIDRVFILDVDE